jgi:type IV secretory pathway VirB10-like protein
MNEFEDIEQLLKPQCDFKASDTLKQEVLEKAREEVRPHRIVKMWPWLAAACVAGFIIMLLMPPRTTTENPAEGQQLVAEKVETPKAAEDQQAEPTPEPENVSVETPVPSKAASTPQRPRRVIKKEPVEEPQEEPVQMSEETRMELLLASLNKDVPQMEDINIEEEIRQMRMRGERLTSMCNF